MCVLNEVEAHVGELRERVGACGLARGRRSGGDTALPQMVLHGMKTRAKKCGRRELTKTVPTMSDIKRRHGMSRYQIDIADMQCRAFRMA